MTTPNSEPHPDVPISAEIVAAEEEDRNAHIAAALSPDAEPDLGPPEADHYAIELLLEVVLKQYTKAQELEAEASTIIGLFDANKIDSAGSVDVGFVDFLRRLGYDDADSIQNLCESTNINIQLERGEGAKATFDDVVALARHREAQALNLESTQRTIPYLTSIGVNEGQLNDWIKLGTTAQQKLIRQVARHLPSFPYLERRLQEEAKIEPLQLEYVLSLTMEATDRLDKRIDAIDAGDQKVIRDALKRMWDIPRARQIIKKVARLSENPVEIPEEFLPLPPPADE